MLNTESSAPRLGLGNNDHSDVEGQMDFRGESRMGWRDWERGKIRWEAIRLCSHDRSAWLQRSRLRILGNCPEARTKTRRRTRTGTRTWVGRVLWPVWRDVWLSVLIWFQQVKQTGGGTAMIHSHSRQSDHLESTRFIDTCPVEQRTEGVIRNHSRLLRPGTFGIMHYPKMIHQLSQKWFNYQKLSIIHGSSCIIHGVGLLDPQNDSMTSPCLVPCRSEIPWRSAHGGPGSGSPWQRSRSKPWQGPVKLWMILSSTVALPGISEISVIWYRAMGYESPSSCISILNCDGDFGGDSNSCHIFRVWTRIDKVWPCSCWVKAVS